jgi:CubicO group peptidase (beta-lactamase class C family)
LRGRDLQEALEASLRRHRLPGASVAVFDGSKEAVAAVGIANVATGTGVTPDTLMHIGSITKLFTTTLVMQLVDEGRVELDDPVLRHLPELRIADVAALPRISIRMLLNHTSGIDGELLPDRGHDEETIERAIVRFRDLGQLFSPGTEVSYCNAASVIAGALVQRLTGTSWYTLVRTRIFEPLLMVHAATLPEEAILHAVAVGHYRSTRATSEFVRTSRAFLPLSFAPCGTTLMMSAKDLLAFARVHMAGDCAVPRPILSPEGIRAMQTITISHEGKRYTYADGIGLGWMVFRDGLLHHSGGGPGIAAALYANPAQGWAIAIMANAEYGSSLPFINEMVRPWLEQSGVEPYGEVSVKLADASGERDQSRYVGVYQDVLQRYIVAPAADGGIELSRELAFAPYENMTTTRTVPARLIALGEDSFLLERDDALDNDVSGVFYRIFAFSKPDAAGRMQYVGNGMRLYARSPGP